ncbi:MAG TPA: hypothetical protein VGP16_36100 [Asanoa sp.]|jgi:hypothetical protein|nr:hypothetical protein [Asanoa sp.]
MHQTDFQLRYVRHGFMVKEASREPYAQYRSLPGASAAMEAQDRHGVPIFDYPEQLLVWTDQVSGSPETVAGASFHVT